MSAGRRSNPNLIAALDDAATHTRVAERAFNARLQGGCQVPIAGHALLEQDRIWLRGLVGEPDGSRIVAGEIRGPATDASALGSHWPRICSGAAPAKSCNDCCESAMDAPPDLRGLGVLVTRPKHQADTLCPADRRPWRHRRSLADPGHRRARDPAPALALFDRLTTYDLAIFTSANAVEWALPAIRERGGIP